MFNLQPSVHLDEPEIIFDEEFDRSRTVVPDGLCGFDSCVSEPLPEPGAQPGRGSFLHNLLVASLNRAITFMKVDIITMRVTEHLDLDMSRPWQELFHEQNIVTEGREGLAPRRCQCSGEFARCIDDPHATSATTRSGLDHDRKSDFVCSCRESGGVLGDIKVAGEHRYTGQLHDFLCFDL